MKKTYTNGNITVTWEPDKCIHSTNCWRGLGSVFQPRNKPWINMDGANDDAIMDQINKCPSGALGYFKNSEGPDAVKPVERNVKALIAKKEPAQVNLQEGKSYAWCACGRSAAQPFCDGTHNSTDLRPKLFKHEGQAETWLCQCKQTGNPPFCDGIHNKL